MSGMATYDSRELYKDYNDKEGLQDLHKDGQRSEIQEFYSGTNIFITGATGFMGKALIDKLLRSCPNINKIYLLLRSKKGRNVEERMTELISNPVFERLKREQPGFGSKLQAVAGDVSLLGLGIGEEDRRHLAQQVHVVFHMGATVRFDEKLDVAITTNVRGTRELLSLCWNFKKVKAIVHVSTAYSNCPRKEVDEGFYPAPINSDQAIQIAATVDSEMVKILTTKLLGPWPNTYTFSKAIAEECVSRYGQGLPIGVYRPAIVTHTNSEPVSGWVDNLLGPSGLVMAGGTGFMRTMLISGEMAANLVPCDLVVNGLITSAWDIAVNRPSNIPIYNYTGSNENKITWKEYITYFFKGGREYPLEKSIWYPFTVCERNKTLYVIYSIFLNILPALLIDFIFSLKGEKLRMMPIYRKIHSAIDILGYFTLQQWNFKHNNVDNMWQNLTTLDQHLFYFNMATLDWPKYFKDAGPGVRLYMAKENIETLPAARAKMLKLKWLHRGLVFLIFSFCGWISWICLKRAILIFSSFYLRKFNLLQS